MNIKTYGPNDWTAAEVEKLLNMFASGESIDFMANTLGRPWSVVMEKLRELGMLNGNAERTQTRR
jgi:hypothetical protein